MSPSTDTKMAAPSPSSETKMATPNPNDVTLVTSSLRDITVHSPYDVILYTTIGCRRPRNE